MTEIEVCYMKGSLIYPGKNALGQLTKAELLELMRQIDEEIEYGKCSNCAGYGVMASGGTCPSCNGEGRIQKE